MKRKPVRGQGEPPALAGREPTWHAAWPCSQRAGRGGQVTGPRGEASPQLSFRGPGSGTWRGLGFVPVGGGLGRGQARWHTIPRAVVPMLPGARAGAGRPRLQVPVPASVPGVACGPAQLAGLPWELGACVQQSWVAAPSKRTGSLRCRGSWWTWGPGWGQRRKKTPKQPPTSLTAQLLLP